MRFITVLADERYNDKLLVIRNHTFGGGLADATYLNKNMPELSQGTVGDFQTKNQADRSLQNALHVSSKVVFMTDNEETQLFRKMRDGWSLFYKKYPKARGIISLSGIGFNRERTQALLNVGIGCGWLCGEGNFILLHKENGKWSIQAKVMTWVS